MIHFVVTCTNRKRDRATTELLARNLPTGTSEQRSARWVDNISSSSGNVRPASEMYQGSLWQASRALVDNRSDGRLWVCSAGYGLIRPSDPVRAYGATFAQGNPDSVSETAKGKQAWWAGLNRQLGPARGTPTSLQDLVSSYNNDSFLFALSASYLDALGEELLGAIENDDSRDRIAVVSSGIRSSHPLRSHILHTDARWQKLVGGALPSLNPRIASWLVAESNTDRVSSRTLGTLVSQTNATLDPTEKWDRKPLTDEEVKAFIRSELEANPKAKRSPLLRKLRDSNKACEQSRFKTLFEGFA